jgi:hypothetical protein
MLDISFQPKIIHRTFDMLDGNILCHLESEDAFDALWTLLVVVPKILQAYVECLRYGTFSFCNSNIGLT